MEQHEPVPTPKEAAVLAARIAGWKKQYGKVYEIRVAPEEEGEQDLVYYFRAPDRKILAASQKMASIDPLQAAEVIIKNCLIQGDENALEDMSVFQAVAEQFGEINKVRESQIKKL